MAIESYSDLQTSMAAYLKRQDLATLLPTFISLAEEQFDDNIFTRARRATFIITPSQNVVPLPSDWERVIDAFYDGKQLQFRGPGNASPYAGGHLPVAYGIYQIVGDNFVFTPTSAQLGLKLQIDYYTTLEPLSATNVSNWLLEDSPASYLFGALTQAAIYIRDNTSLALWSSLRDQAIQSSVDADERAKSPENGPLQIVAG